MWVLELFRMAKRLLRPPYPPFNKRRATNLSTAAPAAAGSVANGSPFTITGSGFGTRTVTADIFDRCDNADVATLWNDAVGVTYESADGVVAMPYASATIVEFQAITSWADTSISITVNTGALSAGPAWLYVFGVTGTLLATQQVTVA